MTSSNINLSKPGQNHTKDTLRIIDPACTNLSRLKTPAGTPFQPSDSGSTLRILRNNTAYHDSPAFEARICTLCQPPLPRFPPDACPHFQSTERQAPSLFSSGAVPPSSQPYSLHPFRNAFRAIRVIFGLTYSRHEGTKKLSSASEPSCRRTEFSFQRFSES